MNLNVHSNLLLLAGQSPDFNSKILDFNSKIKF